MHDDKGMAKPEDIPAVREAIERSSKIDACKAYRTQNNCGLKEAFEAIIPRWDELRALKSRA